MALHLFESNRPGARYLGWFGDETANPTKLTGVKGAHGIVGPADLVPDGTPTELVSLGADRTIEIDSSDAASAKQQEARATRKLRTAGPALLPTIVRLLIELADRTPDLPEEALELVDELRSVQA